MNFGVAKLQLEEIDCPLSGGAAFDQVHGFQCGLPIRVRSLAALSIQILKSAAHDHNCVQGRLLSLQHVAQ